MCRCPHKFAADLRAAGRGWTVTPHFLPFNYPAVRRAARAQRRAAALSGPASLAFRFPWRLRAVCPPREHVCAAVHVRDRAPWLQGRGGGGEGGMGRSLLAGRPGQLLSRCLRQPQGQSGLSGKNLGWSDIRAGMQEWKEHKKKNKSMK